jgi:hypothetical protein
VAALEESSKCQGKQAGESRCQFGTATNWRRRRGGESGECRGWTPRPEEEAQFEASMREKDETPADEARAHSPKFLGRAASMAKKKKGRGKKRKGGKRGAMRYA